MVNSTTGARPAVAPVVPTVPRPRSTRLLVSYAVLVAVPAALAILLLNARSGSGTGTAAGTHSGADPHALAKVLLAVAVVLGACAAFGALARRFHQPAVIGEIAAGITVGPSVLGALWPSAQHALLPASVLPSLNVLAQLGVVLFVFVAGFELNAGLLRGRGALAVMVSHVSIAVPFLLGVSVAFAAYGRFAPDGIGFTAFALFMAVSMSITALPVLARILMDLGLHRTEVGTVALTCAVVDDITAWCLLALVVALVSASSVFGVLTTVLWTALFVTTLIGVVRPALARFCASEAGQRLSVLLPVGLVGLLAAAVTTEWIGVHAMFGAFMFGLVFPSEAPGADRLRERVGNVTTVLLPLFFAYSGLRTEVGLLGTDPVMWLWCALFLAVAVIGKLVGGTVAARASGVGWRESGQLGALMNCRGLTELVVLNIGLDLGVLSPALFTMLVIMALVSTAMSAPLVTRLRRPVPVTAVPPVREPEAA
jgi:Kef-type K+ transport system membrane component KefB